MHKSTSNLCEINIDINIYFKRKLLHLYVLEHTLKLIFQIHLYVSSHYSVIFLYLGTYTSPYYHFILSYYVPVS